MPWFILAVSHRFEVAALAFGCLLILGALLSGLARRTFVSLTRSEEHTSELQSLC